MALIFAGFMLFNLMTNVGPNAQTYLLAGEVFPTQVRGMGAGFAAAFAKIGAVTTAFLFPILLVQIGTRLLLCILVGTSLLGAVVTWAFRIETTGVTWRRSDSDDTSVTTVDLLLGLPGNQLTFSPLHARKVPSNRKLRFLIRERRPGGPICSASGEVLDQQNFITDLTVN